MDSCVEVVCPYLHSDADRMHLLLTCKTFYALRDRVRFTEYYDYEYSDIKHLSFLHSFTNVHLTWNKKILAEVPYGVTTLCYHDTAPINPNLISDTVRHIEFYKITKIESLPKNVKSITIAHGIDASHLVGVKVEYIQSYYEFEIDRGRNMPSGWCNRSTLYTIDLSFIHIQPAAATTVPV